MNVLNVLLEINELVYRRLPALLALRYHVSIKPDGSPVTEADILLEREITLLLESVIPGIHVIGEESFRFLDNVPTESWIAVVDPVDGTENFCSGLKEWGVSLTIWKDGQHQASLLLMPELREHLMTGDTLRPLKSRIIGLSSTVTPETFVALKDIEEARITGCAVYNLFNVIRGSFSRFLNPRGAYSWDLLAGIMLALEHKCDVLIDEVPYDGRFLEAGRRYRVDIRHRYDLHSG